MNKIKEFVERLKKIKHIEVIIAVVAIIIMLGIYFSSTGIGKKNKAAKVASTEDYCSETHENIVNAVKKIKGVGRAEVAITWSGSVELVYAENISSSGNSSSSSLQVFNGSDGYQPILIKKIYPKAVGAVVVCEGGSNAEIKVNVMMAISTLLDLSTDKILVFEMNKK